MKEQEQNLTNGPIELDLFTPAQLADHAMAAAAEEAASEAAAADGVAAADKTAATASAAAATASASAASTSTSAAATPAGDADGATNTQDAASQGAATEVRKKKKKKKKKKGAHSQESKPKTFLDQINDLLNEDEETPIRINVHGLVGGDGLPGFFKRNWAFISIIVFFTCIYVTCRYLMQEAVLDHDKLAERLIDSRYKTLTLDSELLERTLSSHIEKQLKDSTIHTPTEQSYPLPME